MNLSGIQWHFVVLFTGILLCVFSYAEDFATDEFPLVVNKHTAWNLVGAEERIDALRKGDFSVSVHLESGEMIPLGAEYTLKQIKHKFLFGGSLSADFASVLPPLWMRKAHWQCDHRGRIRRLRRQ